MINHMRQALMRDARLTHGTTCEVCGKHAQVYRRKFNSRMARVMKDCYRIFKDNPGGYLEVGNYIASKYGYISGEHGKLVWWELLEKKMDQESQRGGKCNGLYRMTEKGFEFVRGEISVPSHAHEYNSRIIEWEGDIKITEALGENFDYEELMDSTGVL